MYIYVRTEEGRRRPGEDRLGLDSLISTNQYSFKYLASDHYGGGHPKIAH